MWGEIAKGVAAVLLRTIVLTAVQYWVAKQALKYTNKEVK